MKKININTFIKLGLKTSQLMANFSINIGNPLNFDKILPELNKELFWNLENYPNF